MKQLIKLLFPKVYQEIINEGFEKGLNHEVDYGFDLEYHHQELHHDYDYDYLDIHNESDDMCYHDVSCELSLKEGDKIHLKSKLGIYTVKEVYLFHFVVSTAHDEFSVSNDDYKCHAGGNWNFKN